RNAAVAFADTAGIVRGRSRSTWHRAWAARRLAGTRARAHRVPRNRGPGLGTRVDGSLSADAIRAAFVDLPVEYRATRQGCPSPRHCALGAARDRFADCGA